MRFILFILILPAALLAKGTTTVCLNMIVRNEAHVIKRCLDSVRPVIDYWVIVDTGSEDGTQDVIRDYMKDIPGVLYERPWKNFGYNRSEAIQLAKGSADYLLFMDADDILEFEGPAQLPELSADGYNMWWFYNGSHYLKPQIVRTSMPWRWVGVLHEYVESPPNAWMDTVTGVHYRVIGGGHRHRDPFKYQKHAQLLEDALKEEPNNSRYVFYLAESYRDANEKGKAIEWYHKRALMGGWQEEVYWSLVERARMMQEIGLPDSSLLPAYQEAYNYRPHRPEAPYYLAGCCNRQGNYNKAYRCLQDWFSMSKPVHRDVLFVQDWIESSGLYYELATAAFNLGRFRECLNTCNKMLTSSATPRGWRPSIEVTQQRCLEALKNYSPAMEMP